MHQQLQKLQNEITKQGWVCIPIELKIVLLNEMVYFGL